jgi:hypothetical protein
LARRKYYLRTDKLLKGEEYYPEFENKKKWIECNTDERLESLIYTIQHTIYRKKVKEQETIDDEFRIALGEETFKKITAIGDDELNDTEKEAKRRYDSTIDNLFNKYDRFEWGVHNPSKTAKFANEVLKEFCNWRNNLGK